MRRDVRAKVLWEICACVLALVASQPASAQDSALVVPGAHVRYSLREISKPVEAVVVSRSSDQIRVLPIDGGDTLEFALSSLRQLEVRRREDEAVIGAAIGLFGGAIAGSFRFEHGGTSGSSYQGGVTRAYVFAVVCAGVGWLLGSRVHRYRWQEVPLVPDDETSGRAPRPLGQPPETAAHSSSR